MTTTPATRDYPVQPVPFTQVQFNDAFWSPRIEINRSATIPFAFDQCERTGRVDLLVRTARAIRGEPLADRSLPAFSFDDSDIYKIIEGAAFALCVKPDAQLEAYIDGLVEKIAAAQEPDGYLYPARAINPESPHRWAGRERWELERRDSHELYNMGHLYEAAVAYFQATGKRALLAVATKSADLLVRTFGPGKRAIWPGHQITEMGLARLYRVTGRQDYLDLAKFLLDSRGPDGSIGGGREYNQSHKPVVEQDEAVGHAVRATYMYAGMADVAALSGDESYTRAIDRIWQNVAGHKLYITGGIGATASGEAFGANYELPNMSAYCETCAAIGNIYWNHRLFLLHGDAKYIDVLERTLYNGMISGVSLDGKAFFYPNPLESNGQHQRSPWFGCACCPSNVTRFLASIPGYAYAMQANAIYVNLFASGLAEVKLEDGHHVTISQETNYPWDGTIRLTVRPQRTENFAILVRIPGWARHQPVPSNLYRYVDASDEPVTLSVNGKAVEMTLEKGYVRLERDWAEGDVIELVLPMPVRRVAAHEQVAADRGRIALERGPVVYCAEWPDNPQGQVRNLLLPDDVSLAPEWRADLLGGVVALTGRALALSRDENDRIVKADQPFTAIPYFAWANRGPGQMVVWIPNSDAAAKPLPHPTIASQSKATASAGEGLAAVNDLEEPAGTSSHFHWWPNKGTQEWIEYAFAAPARVSGVQVWWWDDTGQGDCRVPAEWRVLYRDGDTWRPVQVIDRSTTARGQYNTMSFQPVNTTGLRLEVTLQPEFSGGVHEWVVIGKEKDT